MMTGSMLSTKTLKQRFLLDIFIKNLALRLSYIFCNLLLIFFYFRGLYLFSEKLEPIKLRRANYCL